MLPLPVLNSPGITVTGSPLKGKTSLIDSQEPLLNLDGVFLNAGLRIDSENLSLICIHSNHLYHEMYSEPSFPVNPAVSVITYLKLIVSHFT